MTARCRSFATGRSLTLAVLSGTASVSERPGKGAKSHGRRPRLLAIAVLAAQISGPVLAQTALVYVGAYTRPPSKGISAYRFDPSSGQLTPLGVAAETDNPTFLAVHPNRKFLYAANENPDGAVSAFAIDPSTSQLKLLNRVSSRGSGPCHVVVDRAGHWLYAANYNSGSMAAIPIREDGSLGDGGGSVQHAGSSVNPQRQRGPHAHSANLAPDGRFLLAADLGLDQILVYRLDGEKGSLAPGDPPFTRLAPGSGPRHMAFSRDGRFAYVVNEMLATVTAFRYDAARGRLEELQTVSITPADYTGAKSGAEIAVHPNGRFLYASNRGDSTIAVFRVDEAKGTLAAVERTPTGGKTPRNFAIDPTGAWLLAANQDSGSVAPFRIDPESGRLSVTGKTVDVASPVCIVFVKP